MNTCYWRLCALIDETSEPCWLDLAITSDMLRANGLGPEHASWTGHFERFIVKPTRCICAHLQHYSTPLGFAKLASKPWLCATCGMCDGLHQEAYPNRLTTTSGAVQLLDFTEYFRPYPTLMLQYLQHCCSSNILMRSCQAGLQAQPDETSSNRYLRDKLARRGTTAAALPPAYTMSSSS